MPFGSGFLKWLNTLPTENILTYVQRFAAHMKEKHLSVRISEIEMKILDKVALNTKRTKTDLIREWIRSLEKID
jgi:hypothetical protein